MPPRKEPKETVVYPASKRKAPPFKPQRPLKAPRNTAETSSSAISQQVRKPTAPRAAPKAKPKQRTSTEDLEDSDEEAEAPREREKGSSSREQENIIDSSQSSSNSDLPADPLHQPKRKKTSAAQQQQPPSRNRVTSVSPSIDSLPASPDGLDASAPVPSQSDIIPSVPRPLLVRLLYEHFADKTTKIDKLAIQVLQKYVEVFVREAIARAALRKKEEAEAAGSSGDIDVSWLELEDLEKVAAGMMLDF